MIHSQEIWQVLENELKSGKWVSLDEIYKIIEKNLHLDSEDNEPDAEGSVGLKWKRNVRNVLQKKKEQKFLLWDKDKIEYALK